MKKTAFIVFLFSFVLSTETSAQISVSNSSFKQAVDVWYFLNELCRGGSGDNPETHRACENREKLGTIIQASGYCYGKPGQVGSQQKWDVCVLPNQKRDNFPAAKTLAKSSEGTVQFDANAQYRQDLYNTLQNDSFTCMVNNARGTLLVGQIKDIQSIENYLVKSCSAVLMPFLAKDMGYSKEAIDTYFFKMADAALRSIPGVKFNMPSSQLPK